MTIRVKQIVILYIVEYKAFEPRKEASAHWRFGYGVRVRFFGHIFRANSRKLLIFAGR